LCYEIRSVVRTSVDNFLSLYCRPLRLTAT